MVTIMAATTPKKTVSESELKKNAKAFEMFWLRPRKFDNQEFVLQMEITKNWNGWKLKDALVQSIGLEVGDTINTEVKVLNGPGLIDNADDTDLFADGEGADWLLENEVGRGSVINAKVKFKYSRAPVGGLEGREVWKLSLVFVEGYNIVREKRLGNELRQFDEDGLESVRHRLL